MNWKDYIKHMESWGEITIDPKSFTKLKYATSVTPKHYLAFAEKDLSLGDTHGLTNALSNARRAINCQITSLLTTLKLKNTGDLQTKIKSIENIGVLAPRVTKKINNIQTLLENNFCTPRIDEVEDAIDIASLFVEATDKVFQQFMDSWWLTKKGCEKRSGVHFYKEGSKTFIVNDDLPQTVYSDGLYIQYDQESGDYGIWGYLNGREVFEAEVLCGSPLDIEIIKCSILTSYNATDTELKDAAINLMHGIKGKEGISIQ